MPLEIKKHSKETNQSLLRRFTKAIQQSGILAQARKIQFKLRNKSKQMKKRSALRKNELKKKYEKLKKLGRI